jgi:hypothetical protein
MSVKVGDTVIATGEHWDISKGKEYVVERFDVVVTDDDGDQYTLLDGQYTTAPQNDNYTRILEAIAGPEAVEMARNISEALAE